MIGTSTTQIRLSIIKQNIMKPKFFSVIVAVLAAINIVSAQEARRALTNKDVADMIKSGQTKETIVTKISSSNCNFDLSDKAVKKLKQQGVDDELVKAMTNKSNPAAPATTTVPKADTPKIQDKETVRIPFDKDKMKSPIGINGQICAYDKEKGTLRPLVPRPMMGIQQSRPAALESRELERYAGMRSPVRLTIDKANSFVIKTGSPNPPEIALYKIKAMDNERTSGKKMTPRPSSQTKNDDNVITVNISKIQEGVYEITPAKLLDKGEYIFTTKVAANSRKEAFTFGID